MPTRSNYWLRIFFQPFLNWKTVRELLISNMHNNFKEDTWKTFQVMAPTRSNYWRKNAKNHNKLVILLFFTIIEIVRELVISHMPNKFGKDTWKTFNVITPTRSNYWRKMRKNRNKSATSNIFSAIIELVRELPISNMKTKRIHEKLFKLSHPQGQIIDVKCEKSQLIGHFEFFSPLLNLSENWSLVTCLTNLGRIHEKLLKLSRPQVNVNADAAEL